MLPAVSVRTRTVGSEAVTELAELAGFRDRPCPAGSVLLRGVDLSSRDSPRCTVQMALV